MNYCQECVWIRKLLVNETFTEGLCLLTNITLFSYNYIYSKVTIPASLLDVHCTLMQKWLLHTLQDTSIISYTVHAVHSITFDTFLISLSTLLCARSFHICLGYLYTNPGFKHIPCRPMRCLKLVNYWKSTIWALSPLHSAVCYKYTLWFSEYILETPSIYCEGQTIELHKQVYVLQLSSGKSKSFSILLSVCFHNTVWNMILDNAKLAEGRGCRTEEEGNISSCDWVFREA